MDELLTVEGTAAFRAWLRQRGSTPAELGATAWAEVAPLAKSQATSPELARRHYLTVWFQQETTAQLWRKYREAIHRVCDPTGKASDRQHGCILRRLSAYARLLHREPAESGGLADAPLRVRLGRPFPRAGDREFLHRRLAGSVARFGQTQPGVLWFPCRTKDERGIELSGMSALIRGLRQFHLYGYGPKSSQWEWFSDDRQHPGASVAVARTLQTAARIEGFLFDGRQPEPQVAVLHSRAPKSGRMSTKSAAPAVGPPKNGWSTPSWPATKSAVDLLAGGGGRGTPAKLSCPVRDGPPRRPRRRER